MLSPEHHVLYKSECRLHNQNCINSDGCELHQTLVTASVADGADLLIPERTGISSKMV